MAPARPPCGPVGWRATRATTGCEMKGLPVWILVTLVALTALLLVVGWHDREEAGYLPFIMGILFALFALAAIGGKARGDED